MSKKTKETKKVDIPVIVTEKYININKIEESENRIYEDRNIMEKLKKENYSLFNELKMKEHEYINATKTYERIIDEKNRGLLIYEEDMSRMRTEKNTMEQLITEKYEEKLNELKNGYNKRIEKLNEDLDHYKDSYNENKAKKKTVKEDVKRLNKENNKLSQMLQNNIQSYEGKLSELRENQDKELHEMRKREEEFLKTNEDLMDTDIYSIYKDIKKKCEEKISECINYRGQNEKIADENKLFKLNLDNSENMIKQCAKLQSNQGKIIKNYKEQIIEKTEIVEKLKNENRNDLLQMNYKFSKIIDEKDFDLKTAKNTLTIKNEENVQLRTLSQIILDQRSEIEQFFIESLEEVKIEIFKRKKEAERKGTFFPNLGRRYEDQINARNLSKKVNIKYLNPEDKEKVLRLLFSKINENYKPKSYKYFDVIYNFN